MARQEHRATRWDPRPLGVAALWLAVAGLVILGCSTGDARVSPEWTAGHRTIRIDLLDFRFEPAVVDVQLGEEIRFVAVNRTDLPHELFIGSPTEQDAHHALHVAAAAGSGDALEDGSTGVYVPARGTTQFTYRFDTVGEVLMGCHLVGHWEAGMVGMVRVGAETEGRWHGSPELAQSSVDHRGSPSESDERSPEASRSHVISGLVSAARDFGSARCAMPAHKR